MKHARNWLALFVPWWVVMTCELRAQSVTWIPAGSSWRYFRGTSEASTPDTSVWRGVGFPETGWETGRLPLFYGEPLAGTEITDMGGRYTTLFLRRNFVVTNFLDARTLLLRVKVDDGFVAWLNGKEIARLSAPEGEPRFDSLATANAEEPVDFEEYAVADPQSVLRNGTNVLAIQVLNGSLGSSDIVLDASLEGTLDATAPIVARIQPNDGAVVTRLDSIELLFSEPVQGVEASDLRINGNPATFSFQLAPEQYLFSFPPPAAGPVTVTIPAGSGITDRSSAALPFAGGTWRFTVDPNAAPPGISISEFLASNDRGIRDDDGDRSDWIEIYNGSASTVSLAGWSLQDGGETWRFPSVNLSANGRLLVWASGKNRTNAAAALHTNFRLSTEGERLALLGPSSAVVYQYSPAYPPQRGDVSYGHAEGASTRLGYFTTPTPGQPNTTRGDGFAPDVAFSIPGGTYPAGVLRLALTPSTNAAAVTNAVIRYTLDGTVPTEASAAYTNVLTFTNLAVQVRARAFATGLFPGTLRSESYFPLSTPVAAFRSDLPVMLIHDFNRGRPPSNTRIPATIQVFEPGTNGFTTLTNPPALSARAGISVRGSSTEGLAKASYRLEFRDEFDNDRAVSVLGLPADGDWVLYGPNFFEPVLIHNPFMHQLSRDIGRYSPRTRFVEVYFVGSGFGQVQQASYSGIYVLQERVEIGGDRVDAGSLQPQNLTAPSITGGYLMKVDRLDPGDSGLFAANQVMGFVEPPEREITLPGRVPQLNYIRNHMNAFGNALYGAGFMNPTNGFRAYVDTPSWIDHHLLNVLAFNVDALRLSAFFYKERNGPLKFGPLWDFDRALGSTDGRDSNPRVWQSQTQDRGTDFFNFTWWDRMFLDPDFFQDYIDRYQSLRQREFSTTNLWRLIDQMANQVRAAQPREQTRWGVLPRGGSYQSEVNLMRAWISNRTDFMDRQFVARPTLARAGGRVTAGFGAAINPPAGLTVYYTLNGTDPRAPGGRTNPAAFRYNGTPVRIDANSKLVARTVNPSHNALTGPNNPPLRSIWSGPVSATYVTDPIPLAVTEIHFHPDDNGAEGDADDFEFVELTNLGTRAVPLAGMRLRGGVDFDWATTNRAALAPGQRGVVVADTARFRTQYPGVTNILGSYSAKRLSNGGERIALFGALDEPVFDFRFGADWQPLADGGGFSLVVVDETAPGDPALPGTWRRSSVPWGSPGAPDPAPVFRPVTLGFSPVVGDRLGLQFQAPAGTSHRLEELGELGSGLWVRIVEFPGAQTNRVESLEVPILHSTRYYRLRRF